MCYPSLQGAIMDYELILQEVEQRIWLIEEVSLIDHNFNSEWTILEEMKNNLIKLIKIKEKQNGNGK